MKYFNMDGYINGSMVDKFIDFYNKDYDEITVALATKGGENWAGEIIIDMLSMHKDATLIIQYACSMGMKIAVESNCKKVLTYTSQGMWHYSVREVSINDLNKPAWSECEAKINDLPHKKKLSEDFAKSIMTPDELKKFKKDKDVFFSFYRMEEIIKPERVI